MIRRSITAAAVLILTGPLLTSTAAAQVIVAASGNNNEPPTFTTHSFQGGGFQIDEAVALDGAFGPWIKELSSASSSFFSGQTVMITETLLNAGNVPWTDWHERILTRTTIQSPDDAPGFLFRENSLSLMADYGGGFVALSEGADYQLIATPFVGPPIGINNDWEAIDIFFEPHAVIQPGDSLKIEKTIFEVFLDANVWQPGEIAQILEYPTPEPTSLALCALGAALVLRRTRAPR
jgi:hypothetical protein